MSNLINKLAEEMLEEALLDKLADELIEDELLDDVLKEAKVQALKNLATKAFGTAKSKVMRRKKGWGIARGLGKSRGEATRWAFTARERALGKGLAAGGIGAGGYTLGRRSNKK